MALRWIFALTSGKSKPRLSRAAAKTTASLVAIGNAALEAWWQCYPSEIVRKVRPLRFVARWKMAEGQNFLLYMMVPLFMHLGGPVSDLFETMKKLLRAVHLLAGYSLKELPEVIIFCESRWPVSSVSVCNEGISKHERSSYAGNNWREP